MQPIATLLRAMHLYSHEAHHYTSGSTFFSDHEFLGELYQAYLDAFDSICERAVGLQTLFDERAANKAALEKYLKLSALGSSVFSTLITLEKELQKELTAANSSGTLGTQNPLQGLFDESEARVYKLSRRVK